MRIRIKLFALLDKYILVVGKMTWHVACSVTLNHHTIHPAVLSTEHTLRTEASVVHDH